MSEIILVSSRQDRNLLVKAAIAETLEHGTKKVNIKECNAEGLKDDLECSNVYCIVALNHDFNVSNFMFFSF
jgi:hypothetical protein